MRAACSRVRSGALHSLANELEVMHQALGHSDETTVKPRRAWHGVSPSARSVTEIASRSVRSTRPERRSRKRSTTEAYRVLRFFAGLLGVRPSRGPEREAPSGCRGPSPAPTPVDGGHVLVQVAMRGVGMGLKLALEPGEAGPCLGAVGVHVGSNLGDLCSNGRELAFVAISRCLLRRVAGLASSARASWPSLPRSRAEHHVLVRRGLRPTPSRRRRRRPRLRGRRRGTS